jgi:hypothetical protein
VLNFEVHVFAWIPQPDVPNPLYGLPGGTARWGLGASGPRFGGDDFTIPAAKPAGWGSSSYRAKQSLAFTVPSFGMPPLIRANAGVVPGLTTVLTAPRRNGGRVCYSLTPTVTKSSGKVTYDASSNWYEATLHGAAHDPVPAAAAGHAFGGVAARAGHALTPDLEWNACIRFQLGTSIPFMTRSRYAVSSALNLDVSASKCPGTPIPSSGNLIHGLCTVRRFPSYVVYATVNGFSQPIYFADASGRSLGEIVIGQTDPMRQVGW